ncbi:MAG TPA: histidine kinase dimerization/phospho-acceptor domain-containing protein, partial [Nitrospira sp.]|nr:histidine kinase dimerization/phospho-acceptor domain-containing protein [Nitrospira sp.]
GLETTEHIWYVDPEIQIVICTAYSDHPWEDVSKRIGQNDKLLILMKPFNSIEVVQLANSLTKKWNLARSVQTQIESLTFSVNQRTADLQEANARLQENIASRIAETAANQLEDGEAASFRRKEEFLAIMSHEIFMPMNELVSKTGLLLDSPLSPEQKGHATTIQKNAQDLLALLKDMNEFMTGRTAQARAEGLR